MGCFFRLHVDQNLIVLHIKDEDGRRVRGRSYPWGTVNIEDRQHCDFTALRTLLLSHHMQVSTVSGSSQGSIEAFFECRRLKGQNYDSSFLIDKENATPDGRCKKASCKRERSTNYQFMVLYVSADIS